MKIKNVLLSTLVIALISFAACEKEENKVAGITLDKSNLSIVVGGTEQLTATVEPAEAVDKNVLWTSSDATIALVNNGLVEGKSAGEAVITAETVDGGFTAVCTVTVTENTANAGTIDEIMQKGFLTNSGIGSVDIACDANGVPYIVHQTSDAGLSDSKAYVSVYNYSGSGTSWSKYSGQNVGICPSEYTTANAPSIAIKDDGTVFVSYEYYDDINDNRYDAQIVSVFDGTNWLTLGGTGTSNNNCFLMDGSTKIDGPSQMAIKQDGTLMLTMRYSGDGYVFYYDNGNDWTNLVSGDWTSYSGFKLDNSSFWAENVNLAIHGNKPYAYIRGSQGCGVLSGPETNGENVAWSWMGSLVGTDLAGQNRDYETPLAISSTGEVYTAYQYNPSVVNANVYVKHFNTTSNNWEIIYTKDFVDHNPNEAEVVISNDILYLVVARYDEGIEIYKYDSDQNLWNFEGKTPDFGATYYTIDVAPGNNGEFYIAYSITDSGSGYGIGAFKYTPASK